MMRPDLDLIITELKLKMISQLTRDLLYWTWLVWDMPQKTWDLTWTWPSELKLDSFFPNNSRIDLRPALREASWISLESPRTWLALVLKTSDVSWICHEWLRVDLRPVMTDLRHKAALTCLKGLKTWFGPSCNNLRLDFDLKHLRQNKENFSCITWGLA